MPFGIHPTFFHHPLMFCTPPSAQKGAGRKISTLERAKRCMASATTFSWLIATIAQAALLNLLSKELQSQPSLLASMSSLSPPSYLHTSENHRAVRFATLRYRQYRENDADMALLLESLRGGVPRSDEQHARKNAHALSDMGTIYPNDIPMSMLAQSQPQMHNGGFPHAKHIILQAHFKGGVWCQWEGGGRIISLFTLSTNHSSSSTLREAGIIRISIPHTVMPPFLGSINFSSNSNVILRFPIQPKLLLITNAALRQSPTD
jgi:hypothetical protein